MNKILSMKIWVLWPYPTAMREDVHNDNGNTPINKYNTAIKGFAKLVIGLKLFAWTNFIFILNSRPGISSGKAIGVAATLLVHEFIPLLNRATLEKLGIQFPWVKDAVGDAYPTDLNNWIWCMSVCIAFTKKALRDTTPPENPQGSRLVNPSILFISAGLSAGLVSATSLSPTDEKDNKMGMLITTFIHGMLFTVPALLMLAQIMRPKSSILEEAAGSFTRGAKRLQHICCCRSVQVQRPTPVPTNIVNATTETREEQQL